MPGQEAEALRRAVDATRRMVQKLPVVEEDQRELEAQQEETERQRDVERRRPG